MAVPRLSRGNMSRMMESSAGETSIWLSIASRVPARSTAIITMSFLSNPSAMSIDRLSR